MDRFIPIVGLDSISIFTRVCSEFKYAITPYHEIHINPEAVSSFLNECRNTNLILSSIMPDDLLRDPKTVNLFKEFALKQGFKYILVWDLPTYLNNYEESNTNTIKSISHIDSFSREFKVIPLKGSISRTCKIFMQ